MLGSPNVSVRTGPPDPVPRVEVASGSPRSTGAAPQSVRLGQVVVSAAVEVPRPVLQVVEVEVSAGTPAGCGLQAPHAAVNAEKCQGLSHAVSRQQGCAHRRRRDQRQGGPPRVLAEWQG